MQISKRRLVYAALSWRTFAWVLACIAVCWAALHFPWNSPWLYATLSGIYASYYFAVAAKQVHVVASSSGMHLRLLGRMSCLKSRGYYPSPLLLNANLQTLFAAAGRPDPKVCYHRELVGNVYVDGEVCVLDWSYARTSPANTDVAPVVIIFHGLTGGSDDSNMHYLTKYANDAGWHVVIPVRRGCAEAHARGVSRGKHYAYGDIQDTERAVEYIYDKMRGHPLFAVGISAGSNVMCNYLGCYGGRAKVRGAISVANGYCWEKGTAAIRDNHPVWDVIMSAMVHHNLFHRHTDVFNAIDGKAGATTWLHPTDVNVPIHGSVAGSHSPTSPTSSSPNISSPSSPFAIAKVAKKVGSMRDYDERYSRRLHGFSTLEEFYREQSCVHRLHRITVPVMFLNALDDPLASYLNIPRDIIAANPNTLLVTTESGGHLGWAQGLWPFRNSMTWMDEFIIQGISSLIRETRYQDQHSWKEMTAPLLRRATSSSSNDLSGMAGCGSSDNLHHIGAGPHSAASLLPRCSMRASEKNLPRKSSADCVTSLSARPQMRNSGSMQALHGAKDVFW